MPPKAIPDDRHLIDGVEPTPGATGHRPAEISWYLELPLRTLEAVLRERANRGALNTVPRTEGAVR